MNRPRHDTVRAGARAAARPSGLPAGTVSWLEIDVDAFRENVAAFAGALDEHAELLAVVKSNAYGHGVSLLAPAALDAGATWLGVISLQEGLALRSLVGQTTPILVMGHVPPSDVEAAVAASLGLTVYDEETVAAMDAAARRVGRRGRVHLKVETGTHRQGVAELELVALAKRVASSEQLLFDGLSTHFADIEDTTDHRFALQQIAAFRHAREAVERAGAVPRLCHAACSAAVILFSETHFDLARAGIGLYGLWPSRETFVSARAAASMLDLRAVMTWKALIAQVKEVPAGAYIGYGRTWRATRSSRIAVLPVGYYDGYDRSLSGKAHVLVRGRRAPVVGRVCMNMTMIDVTDVPETVAGEVAVLLGASGGERVRAEDIAGWAGTIHYEIVSRIHPSIPRIPFAS
ncbi:MAG: alanine racemase [Acidobacteriota bacterium]|nr:alanine racemase [Acidobacteriota bacterium]